MWCAGEFVDCLGEGANGSPYEKNGIVNYGKTVVFVKI